MAIAHRPTLAQIFGPPPEVSSVASGLPHPADLELSFWTGIELGREPRFPLHTGPGMVRLLVVGCGQNKEVELVCNQEQ